jgi:magnesium-protoporphyrin O-methyltransferase
MTLHDTGSAAGHPQPPRGAVDTNPSPFEWYDQKTAASDLQTYRKQGPRSWSRALIDALEAEGVEGATLLDIGGGIGALQHELIAAGATRAISVEASAAYLTAAREESDRRGHTGRATYHHGDFVDLAESITPADIVTLDRVLNVYPEWERLASLSAGSARRLYGVVVPRDTRFVRLVIVAMNLILRLQGHRVRAAVIPVDELDRVVRQAGLNRCFSRAVGPAWQVLLYRRDDHP